jgi:hypothetical protein
MGWMGRSSNPGGGKKLPFFHVRLDSLAFVTTGAGDPCQRPGQDVEHSRVRLHISSQICATHGVLGDLYLYLCLQDYNMRVWIPNISIFALNVNQFLKLKVI